MDPTMAETIKVVADGGGLVVLVFVLAGLGYLALKAVPAGMAFFSALTARLAEIATKQAVTDTKVDALTASTSAMNAAIVRLGEISQGAIVRAGDAAAGALGKLGDVVQEEARETREALSAAERRMTGTINRELASDPPPPASRPSFTATPPSGMQRIPRTGKPQ
jgi:hypothetical protein